MFSSIYQYIEKISPQLKKNQHRLVLAFHAKKNELATESDAGCNDDKQFADGLHGFISSLPYAKKLIISPLINAAVLPEKARISLGEEYELVVLDIRQGFSADICGVVSGVLSGGGILLLVMPEKKQWMQLKSPYMEHFRMMLQQQNGVVYFNNNEMDAVANQLIDENVIVNNRLSEAPSPYKTIEQMEAVEGLYRRLEAQDDICTIITSGRGRGKSASIGLLAAKLIKKSGVKLLLTAPRLSVADPVFYHLQMQCPDGKASRASFHYQNSELKFIAPDALLESLPEADLVFVDEAAAIPLPMLKKLVLHYRKMIFSTTTHGYEGTGRGFKLKFYKLLEQLRPGWQELKLHQPIRWSKNDPLEQWIEKLLFLNMQLEKKPELPVDLSDCAVNLVDQDELIKVGNETKREAIFSLLVFAHYRTSPSDFQYILENQNVRIYTLEYQRKVFAVLLVNQEGGFDKILSGAIYRGERRPRGHLLAQTLCFHAGYEQAASFKYSRVMRIAVHPEIQGMGFGSYLLQQVMDKEKNYGIDVFGSSFSANRDLLSFWKKAGLFLLRLGFSRDHVSASHSAIVAKALTVEAEQMVSVLSARFKYNFSLWLTGPLGNIADEVKQYIEEDLSIRDTVIDEMNIDMEDIKSFAFYNRNYDACMPAIVRFLNDLRGFPDELSESDRAIINASLRYRNNWAEIVRETKCKGKAEAISVLRSALQRMIIILKV